MPWTVILTWLIDWPTYLMFILYVVCFIFQELSLVITGTLPVFNKTNTGSKVGGTKINFGFSCYSFHVNPYLLIYLTDTVIASPSFFYIIHAYSQIVSWFTHSFCLLPHPSCFQLTYWLNSLYVGPFDPMGELKSAVSWHVMFTRLKKKINMLHEYSQLPSHPSLLSSSFLWLFLISFVDAEVPQSSPACLHRKRVWPVIKQISKRNQTCTSERDKWSGS